MAVLDASAVLALIADEPGAADVAAHLPGASMSAANVAEVVVKHVDRGVPAEGVAADLEALGIAIEPVTLADAALHAALRRAELTASGDPSAAAGGNRRLSLGERCCLALAHRLGVSAVTADRDWQRLQLPVDIVTVR